MKKVLIFLMALSLFAACNNDKGKMGEKKADYREKDDYGSNDEQTDDKSGKDDDSKDEDYTSNDGWSEKDISKFNVECMSGFGNNQDLGKKICPCALEKFQKKYSSYSEVEAKSSEAEGNRIGAQCKDELGLADNNNRNNDENDNGNDGADYSSGGWTSNEVQKFVKPCVKEAQKSGLEYLDAQSYCDCMQYKLAQKMSYAEADRLTEADLKKPAMVRMIKSCLSEH
jgi:hypothetical protein